MEAVASGVFGETSAVKVGERGRESGVIGFFAAAGTLHDSIQRSDVVDQGVSASDYGADRKYGPSQGRTMC